MGTTFGSILFILVYVELIASLQNYEQSLLERLKYNGNPPVRIRTYPAFKTEVLEGNSQILSCQADGVGPLTRAWLKGGHLISNDLSDTGESDNQFLRLQDIQVSEAAKYQCQANNSYGAALSLPVSLSVSFLHEFEDLNEPPGLDDLKFGTYQSGYYAILKSPFIKGSPSVDFQWFKDGHILDITQHEEINNNSKYTQIKIFNDTLAGPVYQSMLVIYNLEANDEGFYKCSAMNSVVGKVSETTPKRLVIEEHKPTEKIKNKPHLILKSENMTISNGNRLATFYCLPYPSSTVILWHHRGQLIQGNSTHYTIAGMGHYFTINEPGHMDSGSISCHLPKKESHENPTHILDFVVSEKPTIRNDEYEIIEVNYNANFTLACQATGRPPAHIDWFHNTRLINDSINKIPVGEILKIQPFNFDDDGIYQCFANNIAGTAAKTFWIKMKDYPPVVLNGLENTTVLYGSNLTLSCVFASYPKYDITWTKNDQRLEHERDRLSLQISQIDQTTIKIACTATNYLGQSSSLAYIHLIRKTKILLPLTSGNITYNNNVINVIIGQQAKLPCQIDHDPLVDITVTWYKGDSLLARKEFMGSKNDNLPETSTVKRYALDGTNHSYSLTFPDARNTDKGFYSCQVHSTAGNDTIQLYLQVVELPYPPLNLIASIVKPNENPQVRLQWVQNFNGNSPILFHNVQYEERGTKDILWKAYNQTFSGDISMAILKGLDFGTTYTFRVRAVNEIGEGSWSDNSNAILIPIIAPTFFPNHFISKTQSPNSILLTWKAHRRDILSNHVLGYIIKYRLTGLKNQGGSEIRIPTQTANSGIQQYLLENLITWKQYTIGMAFFNKAGTGPYTEFTDVWTSQGVPEIAPEGLTAHVLNSTAVRVSWIPPDPQLINGLISGYQLRFFDGSSNNFLSYENFDETEGKPIHLFELDTQKSDSNSFESYISTSNISLTINKLKPYKSYKIDVNCFTASGFGPFSQPPVHAITLQDVPTEIVSISIFNMIGSTAKVTWIKPREFNGIFKGYKINYATLKSTAGANATEIFLESMQNEMEISNLLYSQPYILNISALSEAGQGPPKSVIFTSGQSPTLPSHPLVKNLAHNATQAIVNLELTNLGSSLLKAINTEAQIDVHSADIENKPWITIDQKLYNETRITSPASLTLRVNLNPYHHYRLRFSVLNEVGVSSPGQATALFRTEAANPKDLRDLNIRCYPDTTCILQWQPLQDDDWNGVPSGFNIHLTSEWKTSNLTLTDSTLSYYYLQDLLPAINYTVTIYTVNHMFKSIRGKLSWLFTFPSKPKSTPYNVSVVKIFPKALDLRYNCKQNLYEMIDRIEANVYSFHDNTYQNTSFNFDQNINQSICKLAIKNLIPFTSYSLTLNYKNMMGKGLLSHAITFQTQTDSPSPPIFEKIEFTTSDNLLIKWLPPSDPNGDIISYELAYKEKRSTTWDILPAANFKVNDLKREISNLFPTTLYDFSLKAKTRAGWGPPQKAEFFTQKYHFSQGMQDLSTTISLYTELIKTEILSIKLTWNILNDNHQLPWRNFILRYKSKSNLDEAPQIGPLKATNLNPDKMEYILISVKPASIYYFQIKASNDLYQTDWFGKGVDKFIEIETPNGRPSKSPIISNYKISSERSVFLKWEAVDKRFWNSPTIAYTIFCDKISAQPMLTKSQMGILPMNKTDQISHQRFNITILDQIRGNTDIKLHGSDVAGIYNIHVVAYNEAGHQISEPLLIYIGDPLPNGSLNLIQGNFTNSTALELCAKTDESIKMVQNAGPFAIQLRYRTSGSNSTHFDNYSYSNFPLSYDVYKSCQVVPINNLRPFTKFDFKARTKNLAGYGHYSKALTLWTSQSEPGPPAFVKITDIRMDSFIVSWGHPSELNGIIEGFKINYRPVNLPKNEMELIVINNQTNMMRLENLNPYTTYIIKTAARNAIGLGPFTISEATTGPQKGSPPEPKQLILSHAPGDTYLTLEWEMPDFYRNAHVDGYVLQSLTKGEDEKIAIWKNLRTIPFGNETQYMLPLKELPTYSNYSFRLQGYNGKGVSNYSEPSEWIEILPEMLAQANRSFAAYYNQWWFLIIVALSSTILILLIVSWLCCKSRDKKYKRKMANETMTNGDGSSSVLHLASQGDQNTIKIEHLTHDNTPGYLNPHNLNNHNYVSNSLYQTEAIMRSSKRYSSYKGRASNRGRKSSIRRLSQPKFPVGSELSGVIYPGDNDSDTLRSTVPRLYSQETIPKYQSREKFSMGSFNPSTSEKTQNKIPNAYPNNAFTPNYNSSSSILSLSEKPFEAHSFVLGGENYLIKQDSCHEMNIGSQSYADSDQQSSLVSHYTTSYQNRRITGTNSEHRQNGSTAKQIKNRKKSKGKPSAQYYNNGSSSANNSLSTFASPYKPKNFNLKSMTPQNNYAYPTPPLPNTESMNAVNVLNNLGNVKKSDRLNKFDMMTAGTRAPLPPLGSFV